MLFRYILYAMVTDNIDIFITTHKEFVPKVKNPMYKILYSRDDIPRAEGCGLDMHVCNASYLPLDDRYLSDFYHMKWVRDNLELKDYVGFIQYRKYFTFMDMQFDFDQLFKDYDVLVAKPTLYKRYTFEKQFATCHNIDDLKLMIDIVKELFPAYTEKTDMLMRSKLVFPHNVFIMKREDFKRYVDFEFDCMEEFLKRINCKSGEDIDRRIEENKEKYLKNFYPNSEEWYQRRLVAYLMERLTSVFIVNEFDRLCMSKIKVTETKYKDKKDYSDE